MEATKFEVGKKYIDRDKTVWECVKRTECYATFKCNYYGNEFEHRFRLTKDYKGDKQIGESIYRELAVLDSNKVAN